MDEYDDGYYTPDFSVFRKYECYNKSDKKFVIDLPSSIVTFTKVERSLCTDGQQPMEEPKPQMCEF